MTNSSATRENMKYWSLAFCYILHYQTFKSHAAGISINDLPSLPKDIFQRTIGDGKTSKESSQALFALLDENRDGQVQLQEFREYVEGVGGSDLDEEREISRATASAMAQLDAGRDGRLTVEELATHWARLGALLTVEEVALWVRHAVQLPATVAERFREAAVTGYDFPDLVRPPPKVLPPAGTDGSPGLSKNGVGLATSDPLETELGITSEPVRRRLRRAIRIRMLGIGVEPEAPEELVAMPPPGLPGAGAHALRLSWRQPGPAAFFPVHKYLLKRREVTAEGQERTVTVLDGAQSQFTDLDLEPGTHYTYLLQSWNTVGHSPTVVLHAKTEALPSHLEQYLFGPRGIKDFQKALAEEVGDLAAHPARYVLALVLGFMGALHLRRRRQAKGGGQATFATNSPPSSLAAGGLVHMNGAQYPHNGVLDAPVDRSPPPHLHKSRSAPNSGSGDRPPLARWGSRRGSSGGAAAEAAGGSSRRSRLPWRRSGSREDAGLVKRVSSEDNLQLPPPIAEGGSPPPPPPRSAPPRRLSPSSGNGLLARKPRPKRFAFHRGGSNSSAQSDHSTGSAGEAEPAGAPGPQPHHSRTHRDELFEQEAAQAWGGPSGVGDGDDPCVDENQCCSVCRKRFSVVKRRYRHHCSRCTSLFCQKDGRVAHSNFTPCAIPGSCVCNACLLPTGSRGHWGDDPLLSRGAPPPPPGRGGASGRPTLTAVLTGYRRSGSVETAR